MTTYYKFLLPDLTHHGFTYTEGLNVLSQPFNPHPECGEGGLYFSDLDNIFKWTWIFDYDPDILIACVCLPEDSQNISIDTVHGMKYKSNKIILSNIQRLDNLLLDPDICMKAVKQNGFVLKYVKNQTEDICMEAVKQDSDALEYVKDQTENICIQAVKQNWRNLGYVKNQTENICIQAVKQNYHSLQYVKDQTEKICMEAVKQDYLALEYVNDEFYNFRVIYIGKLNNMLNYVWKQINNMY